MKKTETIFVLLFLAMLSIKAQKTVIKGQVTTFDVIAVEQAEVSAKKSKTMVLTDSLGFFTLECDKKDKLSIKATGFKTKQVKVKNLSESKKINIEIAGDESDIDMAVTKGHISENNLVLAKEYFNSRNLYSYGYNNMVDLIRGKFPNIAIADDELMLRGINSLKNGNGTLIVIKGATYNWYSVKSMDVTNIKNITILTGPAANRYGSGSGNGVLLIELVSE